MSGWIKLYRELKDKAIWRESTPEQKTILITLLMMVNYEENTWVWEGETFNCQPGQCITSINKIKKECGKGVTDQNIKTALKMFEKYEFLTNRSTKKGRLITIVNWDSYQSIKIPANQQANRQLTDSQPTANRQLTPIKEVKKERKKEKKIIYTHVVEEILSYLNKKKNSNYSDGTEIEKRLKAGATYEDCIKVIDNKMQDPFFIENPKHLNPTTLFRKSNYDKNLNDTPEQEIKSDRQGKDTGHARKFLDDMEAVLKD